MAKKSKTQKAKASAARARRKEEREAAGEVAGKQMSRSEAALEIKRSGQGETVAKVKRAPQTEVTVDPETKAVYPDVWPEKPEGPDNKAIRAQRKANREAAKAAEKKQSEEMQKRMEKREAKEKKTKKSRFQFLKDVRAELKRVTWPSKQEVLRWSLVVVAALVFFGVYIAVLDNVVVSNILIAISGLGVGA